MNRKNTAPLLSVAQLDRALAAEADDLLPSSGFAESVMAAVQAEAADPAPIPFPWKRAAPGLAAGCAALLLLVAAVVAAAHAGGLGAAGVPQALALVKVRHELLSATTGGVLLAFALTAASLGLCLRLLSNHRLG